MNFSFSRIIAMAEKEISHIIRDPFTLAIALGLPIMLVAFFGYAIDFEVKNVKFNVSDLSKSRASRELLDTFEVSRYFTLNAPTDRADLIKDIDSEKVYGSLFIKPDFSEKIKTKAGARIQILLDAADNSKTGMVLSYLKGIGISAVKKITGEVGDEPIKVKTRFLYNPELNSAWFMVPGITVIVIGLLSILLTALTIAKEWENGSMELLLSTPARPAEIILGKIIPYAFIVMLGVIFVYMLARLVFNIPFRGSLSLFALLCFIFVIASLSQGVLISVLARQQQIAMQFSLITGLLPAMLLSGFIFPVESMPKFFQYLVILLPPRWFMEGARGIFLKGSSFSQLLLPFGALTLLAFILFALANFKFKTDLEP